MSSVREAAGRTFLGPVVRLPGGVVCASTSLIVRPVPPRIHLWPGHRDVPGELLGSVTCTTKGFGFPGNAVDPGRAQEAGIEGTAKEARIISTPSTPNLEVSGRIPCCCGELDPPLVSRHRIAAIAGKKKTGSGT